MTSDEQQQVIGKVVRQFDGNTPHRMNPSLRFACLGGCRLGERYAFLVVMDTGVNRSRSGLVARQNLNMFLFLMPFTRPILFSDSSILLSRSRFKYAVLFIILMPYIALSQSTSPICQSTTQSLLQYFGHQGLGGDKI